MYAFQSLTRIYSAVLLCLCAALFSVPSVATSPWDVEWYNPATNKFINEVERQEILKKQFNKIHKPANSSISRLPEPSTITKNATGGLSATSQSIIRNMGYPSTFSTTSNYSLSAAKDALKSCVRSPACAGRALGTGGIIYSGIQGWMDVHDLLFDDGLITKPASTSGNFLAEPTPENIPVTYTTNRMLWGQDTYCHTSTPYGPMVECVDAPNNKKNYYYCRSSQTVNSTKYYFSGYSSPTCQYSSSISSPLPPNYGRVPVSNEELDSLIEQNYSPEVSDAPIVFLSGEPESLTLSTPSSVDLPATTTTSTNSLGETETTVTNSTINYNVTNNNTSNPSIGSTLVENTTVYNDYGTVINTSTTTTTSEGVQGETTSPIEFELPAFCSWAEFLCDWLNWTKEPLDEEEPDLSVLISEFEPDEDGYSSGIGLGSCPAPMSLNLGIISQTVEVSYQPFCDFLAMIRPLVIAGAWLISAFMYVGVLRRG